MKRKAWIPYMKSILWKYPYNKSAEANIAVENAIMSGLPELVVIIYLSRRMKLREAAHALNLTDQEAAVILEDFLARIAKNLNLPVE